MTDDPRCWNDLAAENARLREALKALVDRDIRYNGREICIPCDNHGQAIEKVLNARLAIGETHDQSPFDHTGAPR